MPRRKSIKVCPNCGSPEIEYASLDRRAGGFTGLGLPQRYYCKYCGYRGGIVLEAPAATLRRMRFPRKKYVAFAPAPHAREARELAGPVVISVLVVFLLASVLIVLPKREIGITAYEVPDVGKGIRVVLGGVEYDVLYGLKRTIIGTVPTGEKVTLIAEPKPPDIMQLTIITMNETSIIQRATGIGNVAGWWLYILLIFVFFAFAIIGAWSWWRKRPIFG